MPTPQPELSTNDAAILRTLRAWAYRVALRVESEAAAKEQLANRETPA